MRHTETDRLFMEKLRGAGATEEALRAMALSAPDSFAAIVQHVDANARHAQYAVSADDDSSQIVAA